LNVEPSDYKTSTINHPAKLLPQLKNPDF